MPDPGPAEWKRRIRQRASALGRDVSRDVVDELASHVADAYESERERRSSDAEAMAASLRLIDDADFGEIARTRRSRRPASRLLSRARQAIDHLSADVAFDLRYAVRAMGQHLGFSLALVGVLALGIGAATAAYTIVQGVLLRPLPYPQPRELVVLKHGRPPEESRAFAPADWLDYAKATGSLRGLAAYASWPMNLTGGGEPERLRSVIVSGRFFEVAGVGAALGRTAGPADDSPSAPMVVVLSDGFWRRRFGGTGSVLGSRVVLNGQAAVVVGVMPPDFAVPDERVDLWAPMGLSPEVLADRSGEWVSLVGRLQPGVPPGAAQAALSVISRRLAVEYPRPSRDVRLVVRPLLDEVVGRARQALWFGGLAALFVMFAGTANGANLMLVRATVRRDEMAVRSALGAEPIRLARQLLVESGVLACLGAALGVSLSWVFVRAFVLLGDDVPRAGDLAIGWRAVAVAAAVAVVAAGIVGGSAARVLLRSGLRISLRDGSQRIVRPVTQGILLAMQVAFAMVLVTGAALVLRSYVATARVDPGFDTSDTMTMQLTLPRGRYGSNRAQVQFAERALDALRALPGVTGVGVVSDLPFVGNATHFPVAAEGEPADAARMTTLRLADPGFFTTLRIPLLAGRSIEAADRAGREPVAVLDGTAARRYGDDAAIGRRLQVEGDGPRTIVGIVGDIRHAGLHEEEGPVIYVPYAQKPFDFLNWAGLVVRSAGRPPSARALKAAIDAVDPDQPVEAVRPMHEYVAREEAPFRFGALVIGSLAGAALALALTGIYGLTAFLVRRRSRELALRIALGASGVSIVGTVFRLIVAVLVLGTVVGAAGSALVSHLMASAFAGSGFAGGDVSLMLAGWSLIALTAAVAALGPAIRATGLDPRAALQAE